MLKMYRVLAKSTTPEDIAIDIIKSFEADYSFSYKIYQYDNLLRNLTCAIASVVNINEYNNLKWDEQKEMLSVIIKAVMQLERKSKNTAASTGFYPRENAIGVEMTHFEEEGWSDISIYDRMTFPDVFYNKEMQPILQRAISNALLSHKKQSTENKVIENKKITPEDKPLPNIKNISETKEAHSAQTTTSDYISFNLYPSLARLEKKSSPSRLYPDLEGYLDGSDLIPNMKVNLE